MKNKTRMLACLMAVICCFAAFSLTAFAATNDGYYASNEDGEETPPDAIDTISISTENVPTPTGNSGEAGISWDLDAVEIGDLDDMLSGVLSALGGNGTPLTPDGNLTLIDDIVQDESYYVQDEKVVKDKQFIVVESKNGNYFYLVIDRSGDKENVYFLNMVDEADLLALMDDDGGTTAVSTCSCKEHCEAGAVNTDCPICKTNMSECVGKAAEKPVEADKEQPDETEQEPVTDKKSSGGPLVIVLILALAGGGALYWFKLRNKKPDTKGSADLDDYDYGEDNDEEEETEYEIENEDETSENKGE